MAKTAACALQEAQIGFWWPLKPNHTEKNVILDQRGASDFFQAGGVPGFISSSYILLWVLLSRKRQAPEVRGAQGQSGLVSESNFLPLASVEDRRNLLLPCLSSTHMISVSQVALCSQESFLPQQRAQVPRPHLTLVCSAKDSVETWPVLAGPEHFSFIVVVVVF